MVHELIPPRWLFSWVHKIVEHSFYLYEEMLPLHNNSLKEYTTEKMSEQKSTKKSPQPSVCAQKCIYGHLQVYMHIIIVNLVTITGNFAVLLRYCSS